MAHFAQIGSDNKVIQVINIPNDEELRADEFISQDLKLSGKWIQTSYNNKIRSKFAGIGDIYDEQLDIFIPAQPYPSWTWNGKIWNAPKEKPEGNFKWDEHSLEWVEIGETL